VAVIGCGVGAESGYGSDKPDAIPGCRVTPVEVVLGQCSDKPISAEQQRKRFQHRALARAVWPYKHRLALAKVDLSFFYPSELLDVELTNPHALSPLFS
jgi:hypothetical protein